MGPDPDPNDPTPGMHIWGWMSPTELDWLRTTAESMESVVEIGCLHGRSAFALLTGCPGPVFCIDPWNAAGYKSFLGNCGNFTNMVAIRDSSPGVVDQVPTVDMVFIDGAHDYDSVIADIDGWLPKTTKLICGHDYYDTDASVGWEVKRAVDERFGDRVVPAIEGDDAWEQSSIWTVRIGL